MSISCDDQGWLVIQTEMASRMWVEWGVGVLSYKTHDNWDCLFQEWTPK